MEETIIYYLCLIVVCAFFGAYVYYRENNMKNYILATNCAKIKGNFAVRNGYSSQDVLSTCYDGQTKCVFNQVGSLSKAIEICDFNNLCSSFSYNSSTATMSIIKPSNNISIDELTDIYSRQT